MENTETAREWARRIYQEIARLESENSAPFLTVEEEQHHRRIIDELETTKEKASISYHVNETTR